MTFVKFVRASGLAVAAAVATLSGSSSAAEAPLRILVPAYAQAAVATLKPLIEAQTGIAVALEAATTDVIVDRLGKADAGDMVVTSKNSLAPAGLQERIEMQRDVAVSTVGIAMADGAKLPKLGSRDDLVKFLTEIPSFAYSTAQSGRHMAGVIESLGLTEVMKPKIQTGAGLMGMRLVEGKVAAVGQQISELRLAGVTNIVPLPEAYQLRITVSAAAVKGARRAKEAEKVLDVLASAAAAKAYADAGLIPLKN